MPRALRSIGHNCRVLSLVEHRNSALCPSCVMPHAYHFIRHSKYSSELAVNSRSAILPRPANADSRVLCSSLSAVAWPAPRTGLMHWGMTTCPAPAARRTTRGSRWRAPPTPTPTARAASRSWRRSSRTTASSSAPSPSLWQYSSSFR